MLRRLFLAFLLSAAPSLARAETLVFAAASLTEALTAVGDAYVKQGGAKPVFSFAGSSALAKQIENGAGAQLFVSADEEWMDYLAQRKLIDPKTRVSFLGNRLVRVVPKGKAPGNGKLSLADPDSVPAGRYARAALETLGQWKAVEANVVRSDNVRSALAFVERGEVDAGIVYATDAIASQKVTVAETFPADTHPRISYPIAAVSSAASAEGEKFRQFVISEAAKTIFRGFGFSVE